MKARIIVDDASGPNPEFQPPDRSDKLAYARYCAKVPHTLKIAKGTLIEGPDVHVHCLPDAFGKVLAEPADDDCADMVAIHLGRPLPSLQKGA